MNNRPLNGSPVDASWTLCVLRRYVDAAPDAERELPRTAGELPAIALFGFLALGAAVGARALRRRMVV